MSIMIHFSVHPTIIQRINDEKIITLFFLYFISHDSYMLRQKINYITTTTQFYVRIYK